MDFCITIRTLVVEGYTAWVQAGAGIVSESTEEGELQEVNNKLAALKSAIEMAGNMNKF